MKKRTIQVDQEDELTKAEFDEVKRLMVNITGATIFFGSSELQTDLLERFMRIKELTNKSIISNDVERISLSNQKQLNPKKIMAGYIY